MASVKDVKDVKDELDGKLVQLLHEFRERDQVKPIREARWYIIAAVALAAVNAGSRLPQLYQEAIKSLSLDDEKIVQRRIKDAVLKVSPLYGTPRAMNALLALFATLSDDHIDHYGPRYESLNSETAKQTREQKGRQYFDTTWTPEAAEFHRNRNIKYQPDLFVLYLKVIYEWYLSEDTILSNVETQMCSTAALICSDCPTQVKWHTKGLIRHGGSIDDARLAYAIAFAIAGLFDCKTGDVEGVDSIDFDDESPN